MAFNYNNSKTTVNKLLTKFGQSVVITNKTIGSYDPSTGTNTQTITTQNGIAAIFDRGNKEIDGTSILMGDKRMLLSAVDITKPEINDTVLVGSIVYTIKVPLKEINPAGNAVMYEFNLRV